MFKIIVLSVLLPAMANCSGITLSNGKYDLSEDPNNNSKIIIDLNKQGQVIDKNFYGSHFDSYSQMPSQKDLLDLKLGKIRVGGNEFDVNNWKINKSVSSSGKIINVFDYATTAKTFKNAGIDGIFQINLTGYQPEFNGTNYVVNRSFNADSAAELIKTLNGTQHLNITDFSLGNEFSIWNETHPAVWPSTDGVSADEYIDRYIQFAIAIRNAQKEVNGDPNSIKIWGPEISTSWYDWNTGNFSKDCQWTEVRGQVSCSYGNGNFNHFMPYFFYRLTKAEKDIKINPSGYKLLDYVSIHYYPNFRTKNSDPTSVIVNPEGHQLISQMLESTRLFHDPDYINKLDISSYLNTKPNILGRIKQWINDYYPDASLAMNEFAVDSDFRSTYYHPIVRPLYLADMIGILTKENVSFFNMFLLSTPKGANSPWSMIEGGEKKDLFYMYKLFTNNFLGNIVSVTDNMEDGINGYATLSKEKINLVIINKNPIDKKVQIYIKDKKEKKVATYLIPAWSASILKLDKNPGIFAGKYEVLQFGAKEMDITPETHFAKK